MPLSLWERAGGESYNSKERVEFYPTPALPVNGEGVGLPSPCGRGLGVRATC